MVLRRQTVDEELLESLEELLITGDLGVKLASRWVGDLRAKRLNQEMTLEELKSFLADEIVKLLEPLAHPLRLDPSLKPHVVLVVGVNGSGKTTTIGKLASLWKQQGLAVQLVAGDTFRAAATEQLQVWANRLHIPLKKGEAGEKPADSAGLCFEALTEARKAGTDVLLIDTAGRLHNKSDLMAELQKITRVMKKIDPSAPHTVLLVLEAATGQNAHNQVRIFQEMVGVTGLILTKLDGTAKGGVVCSLAESFGLPIHALGVGERIEDLQEFTAQAFANSLLEQDNGPTEDDAEEEMASAPLSQEKE